MNINLSEIKNYLGITTNDDNQRLQMILDNVLVLLKATVWDYTLWTKSTYVKKYLIKEDDDILELPYIEIVSITSIQGEVIPESDVSIRGDGIIHIEDLWNYIDINWSSILVEYEAWFETTPPDILAAVADRVMNEYNRDLWQAIKREQLGPREVEYVTESLEQANQMFLKRISRLIPNHLKVW